MRRSSVFSRSFCLAAVVASWSVSAAAQEPFPVRAERLMSPGRNAASEDSAESLVLNPANLGYQPGAELRWTGVRCTDTLRSGCGHAVGLATPLFFGLGTGLRADFVMPSGAIGFPFDRHYAWLTWGLGWKLSDRLAVGGSVQWSYSGSPALDSMTGVTVGASYRPSTRLAFALVAQDFNGPRGMLAPPRALPIMDRSYVGSVAFRPTGTRKFEVGLEARYFEGSDTVRPRATVGVDIPGVGRARGDLELGNVGDDARRAYTASVGLELGLANVSAGGGLLFGNGLGGDEFGQYGTASLSSFTNPGLPQRARAVSIRLEKTPSGRAHVKLLRALWRLAATPEVKLVALELRASPSGSLAHAEELADALRLLRARGKKTLCSLEDASGNALYVCASADRIVMNPAGGLRYAGLRSQHIYLARLLEKVGVKAEFVRIGAHKSAPEQFTNTEASPTARADQENILRQVEAVFDRNLALYRHLDPQRIREATRRGPFVAQEAKDAGFVDGFAFDDELERVAREMLGTSVLWQKYAEETRAPARFGGRGKIGVLYVEGDMIDGRSQTIPLLGTKLCGSYTIAETAKRLRQDRDIKAVVLRIETPGGSSMAADVMWREIRLLAKVKPVIVSMGSVAASGGYYIASAARPVYALPLTITGSIGIFYGKVDMSGLLDRIGVDVQTLKTTPRADAESLFRGFSPEERVELQRKVGQFYDVFLQRVAEGRGMSRDQVDAVGQGRVWMGQEAVTRGLVDRLGGLREALAEARHAAGLPEDAPLVELPQVNDGLLDFAMQLVGMGSTSNLVLPKPLQSAAMAVTPSMFYDHDMPIARLEWIDAEDPQVYDDAF